MKNLSKSTQKCSSSQNQKLIQQTDSKHSWVEKKINEESNDQVYSLKNTDSQSIQQKSWVICLDQGDSNMSRSDSLSIALAQYWITDSKVAKKLWEIMDNAYTASPTWELLPDYKTMLDCIKVYMKMRSDKPDTQINIANIFWGKGWDL